MDPESMPTDRQVREKLIARGITALSDLELLSLLLQGRESSDSAVLLAQRLLNRFHHRLSQIRQADLSSLRMAEDLGLRRAVILSAALELGRRLSLEEGAQVECIQSDQEVITLFQPLLGSLPHEEFWVLYLNTSNRIIDRTRISQGGVSHTVVDARIIVKRAIEKLAHGMILVHNHPSGNPEPSPEDQVLTQKLQQAAALFDILLMDHLIVTAGPCYSFRNHGFFDKA